MVVAVELLIFMCVNKLLAGTDDPTGMGILAGPNFYGRDGSGVAIPDRDLPIAILTRSRDKGMHLSWFAPSYIVPQLWMKTVRIFIRPSVRPNKYEHLSG